MTDRSPNAREANDKANAHFAAMEEALVRGDEVESIRQFEQGWFWLQASNDLPSATVIQEQ